MKRLLLATMSFAVLFLCSCTKMDTVNAPAAPTEEINKSEDNVIWWGELRMAGVPAESKFTIEGYYGCIAAIPYNLTIYQKGSVITYTLNNETHHISHESFQRFWKTCSSIDLAALNSFYGYMRSTADFRGELVIEINSPDKIFLKRIAFVYGRIEDSGFKKLIDAIMRLAAKDDRLPNFE